MNAEQRIAEIKERLKAILKEKADTLKQISEAEAEVKKHRTRIAEAREQRQKKLAEGGDGVSPLSKEIKTSFETAELLEDKIIGLKNKLAALEAEPATLDEERRIREKEAVRNRLRPYVDRYNELAREMGELSKKIYLTMMIMRIPFSRYQSPVLHISRGRWEGFEKVPMLYLEGDSPTNVAFDADEIVEKIRRTYSRKKDEFDPGKGGDPNLRPDNLMEDVIREVASGDIPDLSGADQLPGSIK